MLTVRKVADWADTSRATIWRWTAAGDFPGPQLIQVRRDPAIEDGTEISAGKYVSMYYSDVGWMRGEPDDERLAFSCGHVLKDAAGATVIVTGGVSTRVGSMPRSRRSRAASRLSCSTAIPCVRKS